MKLITSRHLFSTLVILFLAIAAAYTVDYFGLLAKNDIQPLETPTPVQNNQSDSTTSSYEIVEVASKLEVPWSIVFTSPNRALVSERTGAIRLLVDDVLQADELIRFEDLALSNEEGLMGLAVDPDYQSNSYVYACYAYNRDDGIVDKVVRLSDTDGKLTLDKVVIDAIPAARFHAGCELDFGPDNKLYISTGDATDKQIAQDLDSLGGKILRLNSDGSIPEDNPFPNSPIYSYGHRNPQGLDWDVKRNILYSAEHGPSIFDGPAGGDEINVIKPRGNYGWPLVSHDKDADGLISPIQVFTPAEAPGSLIYYASGLLPLFSDKLVVAALKGEGILIIDIEADAEIRALAGSSAAETGVWVSQTSKIATDYGRIREIQESPTGEIYFTTSNTDGRGKVRQEDDKIYKIIPGN